MQYARKLRKGDKVAIVSLSSGMLGEEFCSHNIEIGVKRLKEYGLEPVFMPNALKGIEYLQTHPQARAKDLKDAFLDNSIAGIICAIGGDDTYRLLPYLMEDEKFIKAVEEHPKLFTGFSDTTINHLMFYKLGLSTYYGPNFICDLGEIADEMLPYTKRAFESYLEGNESDEIISSDTWYEEREDFSRAAIGTKRKAHKEERGFELLQGSEIFQGGLLGGCLESLYDVLTNSRYEDEKEVCERVDYKYNLYKPFIYSNVLEDDVTDEQYRKYGNKKELLAVINEVLFSKWLSGNFFSDEDKINADAVLKRNILLSRDAIFAWLYKGQSKGIQRVLHLVSMNIIKSSITNGYMGKAVKQFNLMKSLDMYLGGNDMENIKDIEDSYIDIRNTLSKKINQQKHSHIESKKEYYYAVGQLVRYYISLNKSKDKYHSLSNPFINATSDDVIKSKLKQFYKKYNYTIKINNNRYNNLYQMILSYIPSGKVISDDIIAGYISNNLIYESKKSEENN